MSRVAIIIPAYLVEDRIQATLAGIPAWVDAIFVVDDKSPDQTLLRAREVSSERIEIIEHSTNRGVGAAIVSGYSRALSRGADVLVVMAGDNQMCPADLPDVIEPIVSGRADYVKGNRLVHKDFRQMPRIRRIGTSVLAWLTRKLSGLEIGDSQCGYTALSRRAALSIPLKELWPRYGYPGHLLLTLADARMRVAEVPVRPIYQGERSGLRPWHLLWIAMILIARATTLRTRRLSWNRKTVESRR